MKTNYFFSKKLSIYLLFGFSVMLLVSCGSSKNTSYNDNDGIYGGSSKREIATNDNKYKEYFSNLNQENQEIFTNVENYSSTNDTVNKDTYVESNNNGWGSNPSSVTINVYDNSWGYGYGYWNNYWYGNNWAWNNWYGPSWGWNSWYGPNYGWGWNSWYGPSWYGYPYYYGNGYYNNYYGNYYGNHYAYGHGRRDTRISYGGINRYNANSINRNSNSRQGSTVSPTRNYTNSNTRSTTTTRSNATSTRNYNNNTNTSTRANTTYPSRDNSNTNTRSTTYPSRDYNTTTPSRSNDTPRSYTPSSSSGSNSSGSNSGGRSSGGGRR